MAAIARVSARKTPGSTRAGGWQLRPKFSIVHVAPVTREEEDDDFERVMGSPYVFKAESDPKAGIRR